MRTHHTEAQTAPLWNPMATNTPPGSRRGELSASPVERSTVGQSMTWAMLPRSQWRRHGFTCATCGLPADGRYRDGSPSFNLDRHDHAPFVLR
jgi:hypothetical protein